MVAKAVVNIEPLYNENYNSKRPSEYECPFCHKLTFDRYTKDYTMADIEHDINCPFLVAKDLLTNII